MSTVEELRKAFAQERVLSGVDWIFSLARALEERVEALEAWNREGGLLYNIGTKLENVADQLEEDRTTIYGQLTEIEETISQDRIYAVNREREEHKARWHATRDAVLPAIAAIAVDHGMSAAECVHDAALYADAAHGPLEQKPAAVIPPIEHASWKMFADPRVEALVKAARAVLDSKVLHVDSAGDRYVNDQTLQHMAAALKPFEATP